MDPEPLHDAQVELGQTAPAAAERPAASRRSLDPAGASARRLIIGAALIGALIVYAMLKEEIRRPPGIVVSEEPYQTAAENVPSWEYKGCKITPLARIRLRARVLGTERYWFDGGSRVSPIDLAFGWGPMSDQAVLDQFKFWQGQRWLHWRPKGDTWPLTEQRVNSTSANMHMIPGSPEVARQLRQVRRGNIVSLTGDLVLVEGRDGWRWKSSLSRTDSGDGACELVWVREISCR
jgi:hypothetical protein